MEFAENALKVCANPEIVSNQLCIFHPTFTFTSFELLVPTVVTSAILAPRPTSPIVQHYLSMASKRPLRRVLFSASPAIRQSQPLRRPFPETSACAFSTHPSRSAEFDFEPATQTSTRPRWQQTPARMVAPVRLRPPPKGPAFIVNEDPRRLNEVYVRMLGQGGDKVLSDEVKWLAVTHKSFDHGRRGHNDRLAFLGTALQ